MNAQNPFRQYDRSTRPLTSWMVVLVFLMISRSLNCVTEGAPPTTRPMEVPPLRWRATKPQLVYTSKSSHRYATQPCIIRLRDGTLLASTPIFAERFGVSRI